MILRKATRNALQPCSNLVTAEVETPSSSSSSSWSEWERVKSFGNWERGASQGGGGNRTGKQGSAGRREPGGRGASWRGAAAVAVRWKLRNTAAQGSRVGLGGGATAGGRQPTLDGRQGRGTESLARLASASPVACRLRLAAAERRRVERGEAVGAAQDFFFFLIQNAINFSLTRERKRWYTQLSFTLYHGINEILSASVVSFANDFH